MLKLGIIQLSIQEGNIEKNCAHIEELVRNHSSDDIDLLCFPELCISGYNFEKAIISDREALFFSELASKYKIAIMAGIIKKRETSIMMLPVFGMKQEHFWESTKKFIYGIRKMIFLRKEKSWLRFRLKAGQLDC